MKASATRTKKKGQATVGGESTGRKAVVTPQVLLRGGPKKTGGKDPPKVTPEAEVGAKREVEAGDSEDLVSPEQMTLVLVLQVRAPVY